jgi:urease accessory protein
MSIDWLPFVLQTSDALFPTGAYAHSLGLEEFARLSGMRDEAGLREFLELHVLPALAHLELPFLRYAHEAAEQADVAGLVELDHEINAWKIPAETRAASARLGGRRLEILLKTKPSPLLEAVSREVAAGRMTGHHLVISGVQYGSRDSAVPLEAALATYLYQTLSSYCVAALKLLRIGQEGCQRALAACLARAPEIVRDSLGVARAEAGSFNPLLEIASMRHAAAFERLFIS